MDVEESRTVSNIQKASALSTVGRTPVPEHGDLLVSKRMARADVYAISVVPAEALLTTTRFEEAIGLLGELARMRAVDGWYTCDHTHFIPIARYRT
jgi:hypothetical protein